MATPSTDGQPPAGGGVVACIESLSAEAGAEILRLGGNATDAAVATAFAQGVVDPIYCGLGGGFHGMFFDAASGEAKTISAGGRAPLAARPDMWRLAGRSGAVWSVEGLKNRLGYQASMTPGFVRGAHEAFVRFGSGSVSWRKLVEPAIRLASEGFRVYPYLYRLWMPRTEKMANFLESLDGPAVLGHTPACAEIYLHPDGSVYDIGETLIQTDYARTLDLVATNGPDEFYEGEIARRLVEDFQQHDGLLGAEDLRACQAEVAEPIRATFRGLDVFTEGAPSVGPVTVEILNILEPWDLRSLGWNTGGYLDRLARAMHVAFRDRMALLGDPDVVDVPEEQFLSKDYAARLRALIEEGRELKSDAVGSTRSAPGPDETTHVSVVDRAGNAAAITHSLGMSSGVVVPGLGFQLNCNMGMFNPVPGQRNSIAPGKRPITGGGPVLFMKGGQVFMLIGSPAGARKVTALTQALLNVLDFGMTVQDAVAAERIHVEDEPLTVIVEPHFPPAPLLELAERGHRVRFDWYTARLAAVVRADDGQLTGGSDPRGDRGLAVV